MARIRSLHPGQWTDEDFVSCSPYARLLTLALRNEADDNGVFEWKPIGIKMRLFPVDNLDIGALLAELIRFNQIRTFEIGGKQYGVIRNFAKFQRPKKPKAVHVIPDQFRTYAGLDGPSSELDDDEAPTVPPKGEPDALQPASVPQKSELSPQMKEEGGNKKEEVRVSNETLTLRERVCDFENFRSLYPKPDGIAAAKRDWDAAIDAGATPEIIIAGLKACKEAWREKQIETRYIPNAARWLAEMRWLDGFEPQPSPTDTVRWRGPPNIRDIVLKYRNTSFARTYLDPSDWDDATGKILTRTSIAADRLREIPDLAGFTIERRSNPAKAA